ncbi:vacuolar protein-sorting-associated protein 25 [Tetranychus urticae]|uniref:Vacuolar protein-sorting-associated protein 25 n=1 Tax=Tetranychus urticae TaxID=32264 RepID=T1L0J5_TETUR|nr:vacuolar protein-sorting-associated protein 25 [Tetranychus urticae]
MPDPVLSDYWQYNFPPFFTIQPNLETRKAQLEAWSSLILNHCKNNRIFKIDLKKALTEPPFQNASISRGLTLDGLITIFENMKEKGVADWSDKNKSSVFIYWNTPEAWANLIYHWVYNVGYINNVCTLYEIVSGDETVKEPFHGLDYEVLKKSLQVLEKQGKATIISLDDNGGVKFLG